jgi:ribonuclease VapC
VIVDTSALVAIAFEEPSAADVWEVLQRAGHMRISAANLLEVWMVLDRRGSPRSHDLLATLLAGLELDVVPVSLTHVTTAREAWRRFGRGSGSPAQLNFGDCFAYAVASDMHEPLLFVGNDFAHTDIESALPKLTP